MITMADIMNNPVYQQEFFGAAAELQKQLDAQAQANQEAGSPNCGNSNS